MSGTECLALILCALVKIDIPRKPERLEFVTTDFLRGEGRDGRGGGAAFSALALAAFSALSFFLRAFFGELGLPSITAFGGGDWRRRIFSFSVPCLKLIFMGVWVRIIIKLAGIISIRS